MNALQQSLLAGVRDNRRDGSTLVAEQAVTALAEYGEQAARGEAEQLLAELRQLAEALARCRPSMVAIAAWTGRWLQELDHLLQNSDADSPAAVSRIARQALEATQAWAERATTTAVTETLAQLQGRPRVLTHSASSAVLRSLQQLAGPELQVFVTESRPGFEGRQLAVALAEAGASVTLVTDAAGTACLDQVDIVLVGADAILVDGSVVNKVGTRALALAAREHHKPFLVSAEVFKRSPQVPADFALETQDPGELEAPAHPRIRAFNPYFDITPPYLISAWCGIGAAGNRRSAPTSHPDPTSDNNDFHGHSS